MRDFFIVINNVGIINVLPIFFSTFDNLLLQNVYLNFIYCYF